MLLREVASAATQAADVLDGGDTAAALAAVDAICATAAQARRLLKAAASGRKPRGTGGPAARPGQLRDLVAAHLAANPDADFTPHAIGRVLGRSSGAVANALDRLTALGQAQLTSDKPRRYRHQATRPPPPPRPGHPRPGEQFPPDERSGSASCEHCGPASASLGRSRRFAAGAASQTRAACNAAPGERPAP